MFRICASVVNAIRVQARRAGRAGGLEFYGIVTILIFFRRNF